MGHEGLLVVQRDSAPGTAQSGGKYLTARSPNSRRGRYRPEMKRGRSG
jgi:hypothetical protein